MADEPLETALRALGRDLFMPAPSAAFAAVVRSRIQAPRGGRWAWLGGTPGVARPVRRSLLASVVLLLAVAAVAAAVGLGVPGIRILFGDPAATPPPTPGLPAVSTPPGAGLGGGTALPLGEAAAAVGFEPALPAAVRRPDAAWVADRRLTLAWTAGAQLPPLRTAPALGLVLTEFRGDVDEGWYEKIVAEGSNTVEPVRLATGDGFWITGDPHPLVYRAPDGTFREETRRVVGDVLIWSDGDRTYRLESSLGRDETVRLAESME